MKLKPVNFQVHFKLGQLFAEKAKTSKGNDLESSLKQAGQKFKQALELQPDLHEAHYGWGQVLMSQAEGKPEVEAEPIYTQAIEKFQADDESATQQWRSRSWVWDGPVHIGGV